MLKRYSGIMSTLAIVVALILVVGGVIIAVTTSSFWVLIYFAVSAALFYFLLQSQALLMEATADNADALAEVQQMLRALDSRIDATPSEQVAAPPEAQHAIYVDSAKTTSKPAQTAATASTSDSANSQHSVPTLKTPSAYGDINRQTDANRLPNDGKLATKIPTTDGRIKCSQCGHVQPAGQIKCFSCGAKFN